jgi:large subunit ribosomal protein L21
MTEFAIIATGGKQYPVSVGDVVRVETLGKDLKKGDKVTFDKVLLVDNGKDTSIGTPFISGAKVEAIFQTAGRATKVLVVKYKAKSKYHKKNGHRQGYSEVKISAIK